MPKSIVTKQALFAVGLGGMIGAMLRYSVSLIVESNDSFPFATLIVNLIGCFLLSFLSNQEIIKKRFNPAIFTGLTTGVIGSFTTFSTFSVEMVTLFTSSIFLALLYCLISIVGGISLCYLGFLTAAKRRREVE